MSDCPRGQRLRAHFEQLKPLARLVLEGGRGTIQPTEDTIVRVFRIGHGRAEPGPIGCRGDFVLPADRHPVLWLQTDAPITSGIARDLRLSGSESPDGPWTIEAPFLSMRAVSPWNLKAPDFSKPTTEEDGGTSWAIATPVNEHVTITYGAVRSVAGVSALVNNLDLPSGADALDVEAGVTRLRFTRREDSDQLRDLLDIGILRTASVTEVGFECGESVPDTGVMDFCDDLGAFCTFASGHHNGVPLVSLHDACGRVCRRYVANPVDTARGSYPLLLSGHTPGAFAQFIRECFDEYRRMRKSALPWHRLSSYCASIEDGTYLEQKVAAVMTALEFFVRTCLREQAPGRWKAFSSMTLADLVGEARKTLKWDIPKHYSAKQLYLRLRNAVAHGGDLPTKDEIELRQIFDKWRLFLFRRVLIRLGYTGRIFCPVGGWAGSSAVSDFTEKRNTFTYPADGTA